MIVPTSGWRQMAHQICLTLISFFDVNLKASYYFDVLEDLNFELSGGVRNMFNSYQPEFDSGPERDSDFIYGPMAPLSVFISLKIGNLY